MSQLRMHPLLTILLTQMTNVPSPDTSDTVVHWKKVLPPKFLVVLVVVVGPRIDL